MKYSGIYTATYIEDLGKTIDLSTVIFPNTVECMFDHVVTVFLLLSTLSVQFSRIISSSLLLSHMPSIKTSFLLRYI